jgi:hypothetical protein
LEPFQVGILKADSLVVPVFLYSNGEWTSIQTGTGQDSARSVGHNIDTWYVYLNEPCYGPYRYGASEVPVQFHTGETVDFFWWYMTSVAEGWLKGDATGTYEPLDARVMLSACDGKSLDILQPLGTLEPDGRRFLIGTSVGYESRQEVVLELHGTPRIIAKAHAQGPGD